MKLKIYDIYICKVCRDEKPHGSVCELSSKKPYTWCTTCQKDTRGKWIKAVEKVRTK